MSLLDCSCSLRCRRAFLQRNLVMLILAKWSHRRPATASECTSPRALFLSDLCHITFIVFVLSLSYLCRSLSQSNNWLRRQCKACSTSLLSSKSKETEENHLYEDVSFSNDSAGVKNINLLMVTFRFRSISFINQ